MLQTCARRAALVLHRPYSTELPTLATRRDALRALQAPLKARYKEDPPSALVRLTALGTVDSHSTDCVLDTPQVTHAE